MTHEQLQDAHIAALREIVELRAEVGQARATASYWKAEHLEANKEIARLQAQLATAKGEVWNCVTHELTKRRNACLEAMARPYAENEWRGKAELFMHLIHWSQKQKEVQS